VYTVNCVWLQRAGCILVYTVNCAGYRPSGMKGNIYVHILTDVLNEQACKLRITGRNFRNKLDKLTATAVHIFPFEP
jgi:hypothetical protein